MYKLDEVMARMRDLREFSDYSQEEFAEKLGVSAEVYAEYESGARKMSVNKIYAAAAALMIDPGVLLTGEESNSDEAVAVYEGNGTEIARHDAYSFVSLNNSFMNANLEPMLVTVKEGVKPELLSHGGQEFNYVLEGMLRVIVGEREYYLKAGDSIYFDAKKPHAQLAMQGFAKFLTVIQKEG